MADQHMAIATKRRRTTNPTATKNGQDSRVANPFPSGSIEAKLVKIGMSISDRAWARVPTDYFANLDHYLYGAPKKK